MRLQALAGRVKSLPGVPLAFSLPRHRHEETHARQKARQKAGQEARQEGSRRCQPPASRFWRKTSSQRSSARSSDSIRSGPRGGSISIRGPFAVFLHAPEFGELAQKLGGFLRYQTAVPPRLSEFAILVTAKLWRAQYEWFAHAPQAERAGVTKETISDLHKGRVPKSLPKDERAIYDFIQELYKKTRRVSDKTYKLVVDVLRRAGDRGARGHPRLLRVNLDDP